MRFQFDVARPVFEATLREFKVSQKVISQPHIYFGMWPAWLRGTSWYPMVKAWLK